MEESTFSLFMVVVVIACFAGLGYVMERIDKLFMKDEE
ncbi:hypothetical protein bpmyx0001_55710 [Bacillus pseudomycoides DSM 12442]|nr:hypothetical protein bpmyx0001_55710 [Bacillus pseudomycoides DSM 12442]